jgi:hypothetical protein
MDIELKKRVLSSRQIGEGGKENSEEKRKRSIST